MVDGSPRRLCARDGPPRPRRPHPDHQVGRAGDDRQPVEERERRQAFCDWNPRRRGKGVVAFVERAFWYTTWHRLELLQPSRRRLARGRGGRARIKVVERGTMTAVSRRARRESCTDVRAGPRRVSAGAPPHPPRELPPVLMSVFSSVFVGDRSAASPSRQAELVSGWFGIGVQSTSAPLSKAPRSEGRRETSTTRSSP